MKSPKFAISKNNSHQFEENKDRLKIGIENNKSKIQNNKDLNTIQKEEEANLKGKHITKSSRNISIRGKKITILNLEHQPLQFKEAHINRRTELKEKQRRFKAENNEDEVEENVDEEKPIFTGKNIMKNIFQLSR